MSGGSPHDESTRRRFLGGLGVGAMASVAGSVIRSDPGTPEPESALTGSEPPESDRDEFEPGQETDLEARFDSVIDVVEAGGDPDGEDPVDAVLEDEVADDTALRFPEGRYAVQGFELAGLSNVGLVGVPDAEVELVPAAPADELDDPWIGVSEVDDFLFEGVDYDFRESGYAGATSVTDMGEFVVRNVTVRGRIDVDGYGFRFSVTRGEAAGIVENVELAALDRDGLDTIGVYVRREHAGELHFRDLYVEGFPDNGLYASTPGERGDEVNSGNGIVHVLGGTFRNNNISNVRLGSTGSTARDVTIRVDDVPPRHPNGLNVRGFWLRGREGQIIENCRVEYTPEAATGDAAVVVDEDVGQVSVRETNVRVNRGGMDAVRALSPTERAREEGPTGPVLDNTTLISESGPGVALEVEARDGTRVRDCCIYSIGTNQDGIVLEDSADGLIYGTTISVTGRPILLVDGAGATVEESTLTAGQRVIEEANPCE